jgi:hypothetical protein
MLLQPGTARLPNVDLAAFTGDAVYSRCPQPQVVLDQPKETKHFLGRQAYRLDAVTTVVRTSNPTKYNIKVVPVLSKLEDGMRLYFFVLP